LKRASLPASESGNVVDRPVLFTISDYYVGIGAKLGYTNLEYDGSQEEKTFFRTYLEHETKRTTLRVGLAFENIIISALDNLDPGEELGQAVNEGKFILIYPYVDFIYDARDSKLNPKYGYYLSAYVETGLSDDEESSVYYKALLEGRFIHTFENLTLAAVGKVGIVDEETKKSLPESKYFFAGGSFSNRAYGFRELGVIISPTKDTIYGAATWANLHFPCQGALRQPVGSEQGNSTWAEVFETRGYRGNTVRKSINQERPFVSRQKFKIWLAICKLFA